MENNLISKKELLDLTGISYGQLYRWKRKNLIPEDWFIKKSTFTGHETFFVKDRILERIDKIMNMKDEKSLDDIAEVFSPQVAEILLTEKELKERNIVSQVTFEMYKGLYSETTLFTFDKVLYIGILEKMFQTGEVGIEEGKVILQTLEEHYPKFKDRSCELLLLRKFGMATGLLVSVPNEIYLDKTSKLVLKLSISQCIQELKLKLSKEDRNEKKDLLKKSTD